MREGSMKFLVAPQSTRVVVATVLAPYCRQMGKWIALSDLFATSTDTRTKEEDVATSSFSKKTLHLFRQLPQLAEGDIITQWGSFLSLPILLHISQGQLYRWGCVDGRGSHCGPGPFRVTGGVSGSLFSADWSSGGFFTRVVPGRTVWLFANKTEMISETLAPLTGGDLGHQCPWHLDLDSCMTSEGNRRCWFVVLVELVCGGLGRSFKLSPTGDGSGQLSHTIW